MIAFLLILIAAQSAAPQPSQVDVDIIRTYSVCLQTEARRLDDGKEPSDSIFAASVESCKKERGILVMSGAIALYDKNAPESQFRASGERYAASLDRRLKPEVVLAILENRTRKSQ